MADTKINHVMTDITEGNTSYNVTFHASKGFGFPLKLDSLNMGVASQVHQAHVQILPFENEIMKWLSLSKENVVLFSQDPFKALEEAKINIPAEVVNNLKKVSELLVNNTNLKK
ncbi:MAG: hypothetical protein LBG15_10740 [Dysgonamonadaceae bacterium]|jgi:hypothetical protein|nr:hypothetical protein [Dysgonamonadaceae bacterium]